MNESIRKALIEAGVRNLKVFGYPKVNATNILTDLIYRSFFMEMLKDHKGAGVDEAKQLLAEIKALEKKRAPGKRSRRTA